jgi:hypothetical protein
MALVQMDDAGLHAHGLQGSHRADAQQCVLRKPDRAVADVEAAGDPAVDPRVLGTLRIEQEESHTADVDAPHLHDDLSTAYRHSDGERFAVLVPDEHGGQAFGLDPQPVFVLISGVVDALDEISLVVEEADAHHGHRPVGGLLEHVTGEHAQPARVDGERGMDGELSAEEGYGTSGIGASQGAWRSELLFQLVAQTLRGGDRLAVAGGSFQGRGRGFAEQAHRIL